MSNPRQDEVDAFFNAIDATQPTQIRLSSLSPHSTSPGPSLATGPPDPALQQRDDALSQTESGPLFDSRAVPASPSASRHQPGMSPAIQKGPVSLGLALGGSGFRRKPLFDPDDDDDDDDGDDHLDDQNEGLLGEQLNRRASPREKKSRGTTFQELTRSEHGHEESSRAEGEHTEGYDEGQDEEEDANSETPLQPQEHIRGLSSRHDFNFFKNKNLLDINGRTRKNSFLTRLGVNPTALSNTLGSGHGPGSAGSGSNGARTASPRLGMGPFVSGSRLNNSRYRGKLFFPRTMPVHTGVPGSAGGGGVGIGGSSVAAGMQDEDEMTSGRETTTGGSMDHGSGSFPANPSPIYPGGMNPYHDDAVDWVVEGTGMRVAYDDFTTIDWIHDFADERQRIRKLHRQPGLAGQIAIMYEWVQGWVVVLAVGIVAGILAGGSDIATQWLGDIKEGYCDTAFYLNRNFCCWGLDDNEPCTDWVPWNSATFVVGYIFYIMFALMFATTAAYLVKTFAPYAEGSGIPEVKTILGGFVIRHYLGLETLVIKTVALVLSTAAGLSLGKEGPLLHISCCIGNILPRIFPKFKKNEAKMREILSAAASAGISVAFGAPIGGVVFSLEEMSYYFSSDTMWHSFFCAMAAAVALKLMDPFRTEKLVVFQVSYDRDWHGFEMIFYMLLGILGGLWGAFFIRMNLRLAAFRKTSWLRIFPIYEVFAITLLTAAVGYLSIFTRVQSPELLANLFRECDGGANYHGLCDKGGVTLRIFSLLSASGVKGLLTILTFGLAIPTGIFMPSMVIGALFGRALGMLVQAWQQNHPGFWLFRSCLPDVPCVTPGSYAMVGAAAFMGGVTRMTVSLVIIMFELTGALTYVLPIMIVVMTSKWVGDAFGKEGIFDGIILLCGYPFLDDKEEYKLNITASQVMTPVEDIVVVTATGNTLDSLDSLLHETHYKGYPVVNSLRDMMLVGYISRTELRYAIDEARRRNLPGTTPAGNVVPILENTPAFIEFRLWMDQTPITVSHRFPMDQVIVIFRRLGVRYVLCTQHGQLLGLITKKDVLRHLASIEQPGDQEAST
ncbi:hypothetical protein EDD11_009512 [Mortierella claussenii]|nr:hypothetical protein EDD11_009512 [Mortierella claussenii]